MQMNKKVLASCCLLVLFLIGLAFAQNEPPKGGFLLVLNKTGNTLSILNPGDFKLLGTVPVGEGPHEVVVTDDGRTAYVTNYGSRIAGNTLSEIDIPAMKERRRVNLGPLFRPHGIKVIGGKVYFSAESNRTIARFDPKSGSVDWIMGTGESGSHMVVGTNDEKFFYTSNIGSNTVTMIALADAPPARTEVFQIPVGKQPEAIDLSPDGKEVWVGLNIDNGIDVIDTKTRKVEKRIDLGARPYRVVFEPNGERVYATIFATKEVVEIDVASREIKRRLTLDNRAFGITFTKDGRFAFVTTIEQDGIVKIDLSKFEVVAKGTAGAGPDGIALAGM